MSQSNFSVDTSETGKIAVSGALTFENAEEILRRTRSVVETQPELVIDLTGVGQTDSASLALLLEWIATARRSGGSVQFESIPDRVLAIAETGEISDLIRRYSLSS